MAQPIEDQVGFLGEACRAVQELAVSKSLLEKHRLEEKNLLRELESERKAVTDAISLTVKKRVQEINDTYDGEIAKEQEHLKRLRNKREKAKTQGVKERIEEETQELKDKNRVLAGELKSVFKRDHVPSYCRSTWYYALFLTRGFSEMFILLITALIFFLAIPCGVYFLIPHRNTFYLAGIYFVSILLFGGIYILINNRTRVRHPEALKKGRLIKNSIKSNRRKLRAIIRDIKKDRNEKVYNLERFDDEIAKTEQDLMNIADKKQEALNTFDKVTSTIISDEIASSKREKISMLEKEHEEAVTNWKEAQIRVKEQTLFINDNYASYIGSDFMIPEKLDELADIIRMEKASTISEAKDIYNSMKD